MPAYSPTPGDVHVDAALTTLSIAYAQRATNFVADKVFPVVGVSNQSDSYHLFSRDDFYRDEARLRGPGTASAGSGFKVAQESYRADVWAIHKDVDDQLVANADAAADPVMAANRWITHKLLIRKDREWASTFFVTGIWTTEYEGVTGAPGAGQVQFWNESASTPIADVDVIKSDILRITGYAPNVMVVGEDVHNALRSNSDIMERIKYTQRGIATEELLASMFGVDRYVVARGTYYTQLDDSGAVFNGAGADYSFAVDPKAVLLCWANPAPAIMEPSAGYTFAWTGLMGANAMGGRVKRFRMEEIESDRIEGTLAFDMKLVSADLGGFIKTCVA